MYIYLVALYDDAKPGSILYNLQGTSEPNVYVLEAASNTYYPALFDIHPDVYYYDVVNIDCIEYAYQILDDGNQVLAKGSDYIETYTYAVELMLRHYKEFTEC